MIEAKVRKTTSHREPCFEVELSGCFLVRIFSLSHDTLLVRSWLNGFSDRQANVKGNFDTLTESDAIRIAKPFCL